MEMMMILELIVNFSSILIDIHNLATTCIKCCHLFPTRFIGVLQHPCLTNYMWTWGIQIHRRLRSSETGNGQVATVSKLCFLVQILSKSWTWHVIDIGPDLLNFFFLPESTKGCFISSRISPCPRIPLTLIRFFQVTLYYFLIASDNSTIGSGTWK